VNTVGTYPDGHVYLLKSVFNAWLIYNCARLKCLQYQNCSIQLWDETPNGTDF
jgi:hypothetical protein